MGATAQNLTLKKKRMIAALEQSLGIVSKAAIEAGIPRQTHYYWMDNDPNYRSICNELKHHSWRCRNMVSVVELVVVTLSADSRELSEPRVHSPAEAARRHSRIVHSV